MSGLLQILKGTSATVIVTFQVNGVGTNLDSGVPAVTLTRPDGTAGPASGTVTSLGVGQYSWVIAPQPEVTWLDYQAVGVVGGQSQTLRGRVEWVGGLLFTVSQLRAMRVAGGTPFSTTAVPLITDAQIMETRASILGEMTQVLGYSPVPRFAREYLDSSGGSCLLLVDPGVEARHPPLSVTVNGTAQSVANYSLGSDGILESVSGYLLSGSITAGRRNVVVEYIHGLDQPPGDGRDVAMRWAGALLNPSGFSSATTVSLPTGESYTYEPSETGRGGYMRWTGIREVDRWLNRHRRPMAA